jgi:hypothetical protein
MTIKRIANFALAVLLCAVAVQGNNFSSSFSRLSITGDLQTSKLGSPHLVSEDCLENIFESDHAVLFEQALDAKITFTVPGDTRQTGRRPVVFEWLAGGSTSNKKTVNSRQLSHWLRVDPVYVETDFK